MSRTIISIERVNAVDPHPNADRLDVIQVLGYQVVTQKGHFEVGDTAVYFPPDILLPSAIAESLGVASYLKHAIFPGDELKTQCRVGAARLRGVASHGFCSQAKVDLAMPFGTDVTDRYGAAKYEPPVRLGGGDTERALENFPKYTSIENIQRYPDAIPEGTHVVITEKIHGTNCRMGLVRIDGEYQFVAGSHNQRRSSGTDTPTFYWQFMDERVMSLLTDLCNIDCNGEPCHDVVVYGEIFGPGVQDMDYGRTEKELRVFDISVDGTYLNYWDTVTFCDNAGLLVVPQLAMGAFSAEFVEEHTYGATTYDGVKCKFKGREGCVVRPVHEGFSDVLGGRMILKSVSADYRDRKGAIDDE